MLLLPAKMISDDIGMLMSTRHRDDGIIIGEIRGFHLIASIRLEERVATMAYARHA